MQWTPNNPGWDAHGGAELMDPYGVQWDSLPDPLPPSVQKVLQEEAHRVSEEIARKNPPITELQVVFMTNQVHHMCEYLGYEEITMHINASWRLHFEASTGKFSAVLERLRNPKRVPADFSTKEHKRALKALYEDLYKQSKDKALQKFLDLELNANNIHRMP